MNAKEEGFSKQTDFVIALGGSIVCPDDINVSYLKEFYSFVLEEISKGKRFIFVVGGGGPARKYQKAAHEIAELTDEDKDWIGVHATRLNAHLLRTIFRKEAHPVLFEERHKMKDFEGHSIIIGAGWRPGWSTDFVAVQIAADFKVKQAIILGKPEHVYDKDHQLFDDAKPIEELNWTEYLKLIPNEWKPGIHAPVDPVAAKLAQQENLEVVVASGKDLNNFRNILEGKQFKGTIIKD